jgi:hypothetical protein
MLIALLSISAASGSMTFSSSVEVTGAGTENSIIDVASSGSPVFAGAASGTVLTPLSWSGALAEGDIVIVEFPLQLIQSAEGSPLVAVQVTVGP